MAFLILQATFAVERIILHSPAEQFMISYWPLPLSITVAAIVKF